MKNTSSLARRDRLTLHRSRPRRRDRVSTPLQLTNRRRSQCLKSAQEKSVHNKPAQDKSGKDLPLTGYAVVVDGQIKTEFKTKEGAHNGAHDLKRRVSDVADQGVRRGDEAVHDIELARGESAGRAGPGVVRTQGRCTLLRSSQSLSMFECMESSS